MSCDFSWELAQLKEAESIGDLAKIQAEDGRGKTYVLGCAGLCLDLGAKLAVNPSLDAELSPQGWVHGVFHPLSKPPAHQ